MQTCESLHGRFRCGPWLVRLLGALILATVPAVAAPAVDHVGSVRTSVGWRDNILYSPFAPEGRVFGRAEVESFLSWSRGDWQVLALLNGDVWRYVSPPPDTHGEQQWFLHGEARWQHWPRWRVAVKADAFLQDQVIDLSETEAVRTVLPARVRGGFVTLAPRLELPAGFVFEPLGQVKRVDYRAIPGDYEETRAGARLEWSRSERLVLSAAAFAPRRRFAERSQYTAGGRPLRETRLRFWLREAELKAATRWGAEGAWRAAATAGWGENRDRASGFFNYDQRRARLELEWRRGAWRWQLEGDARRTDYLVQTVGTGTRPPPRVADGFDTRLRAERAVGAAWLVFAEHAWERARSNEREFSYRAHTVLAGVQRDF